MRPAVNSILRSKIFNLLRTIPLRANRLRFIASPSAHFRSSQTYHSFHDFSFIFHYFQFFCAYICYHLLRKQKKHRKIRKIKWNHSFVSHKLKWVSILSSETENYTPVIHESSSVSTIFIAYFPLIPKPNKSEKMNAKETLFFYFARDVLLLNYDSVTNEIPRRSRNINEREDGLI